MLVRALLQKDRSFLCKVNGDSRIEYTKHVWQQIKTWQTQSQSCHHIETSHGSIYFVAVLGFYGNYRQETGDSVNVFTKW